MNRRRTPHDLTHLTAKPHKFQPNRLPHPLLRPTPIDADFIRLWSPLRRLDPPGLVLVENSVSGHCFAHRRAWIPDGVLAWVEAFEVLVSAYGRISNRYGFVPYNFGVAAWAERMGRWRSGAFAGVRSAINSRSAPTAGTLPGHARGPEGVVWETAPPRPAWPAAIPCCLFKRPDPNDGTSPVPSAASPLSGRSRDPSTPTAPWPGAAFAADAIPVNHPVHAPR